MKKQVYTRADGTVNEWTEPGKNWFNGELRHFEK